MEEQDDFLARERAALGDDADIFAQPGDQKAAAVTVADDDDDLLGGGDDTPATGDGATSSFQNAFPPVDSSNEA